MIKIVLNRIKLSPERRKLYLLLRELIGFYPRNLKLYEASLIHKSALKVLENGESINNERLEYLGDAMLGAIVAHELYNKYPNHNEGFLTKTRSKIVNRSFLNKTANKLGLSNLISSQSYMSLKKTNIPGDALEALIGAIFIDGGYNRCRKFILKKILNPYVDLYEITHNDNNYKSALIEWGQKYKRNIHFITDELGETGGHDPIFVSVVQMEDLVLGRGQGSSKKESQQNAAMQALDKVSSDSSDQPSF
ncbi:RNAse III [Saccharicrinis carchari]|uniref:Ribonuclease 3 n=1 Tax=Saccharicrinis carchari TaxID=1168039 RepID=A0A521EBR3_SACCC|nr:ribonuclease III [Saccharicrinis carchari]SMO80610.1 RNAse III [Saccharicrinis carchari]